MGLKVTAFVVKIYYVTPVSIFQSCSRKESQTKVTHTAVTEDDETFLIHDSTNFERVVACLKTYNCYVIETKTLVH